MAKEIWEWVRSIIIAVLLALLFRMFLLEHFLVDGQSMFPTLKDNERIIVNKIVYRFNEPENGEIIVFNYQDQRDFIKRVIGIEGETIEIRDGNLIRNGSIINESYLDEVSMSDYGPVTVPPGNIFVLGDNRTNSRDSRYPDVGFVSVESVKGRAALVFWPFKEARKIN